MTTTRLAGLALVALALSPLAADAQPSGAELYTRACAQCHDSSDTEIRAPRRAAMRAVTEQVAAVTSATDGRCTDGGGDFARPLEGPRWNGWGADIANTRFQPNAGLSAETVGGLGLKWAFGFAGALSANAQASIV